MTTQTQNKLVSREWNASQVRFMEWLAKPEDLRECKYQSEFAKMVGVTEKTLSHWKNLPGFMEEVSRIVMKEQEMVYPIIARALMKKAEKGDTQAIKLWLEHFKNWSPKKVVTTETVQKQVAYIVQVIQETCPDCPRRKQLSERLRSIDL